MVNYIANTRVHCGLKVAFVKCRGWNPVEWEWSDHKYLGYFLWTHTCGKSYISWIEMSIYFAKLSAGIEHIECFLEILCVLRSSQLSIFTFMHNMGLCVFSSPIYLVRIVRIYMLHFIIIIKLELWTISYCLMLCHETIVFSECNSMFLFTYQIYQYIYIYIYTQDCWYFAGIDYVRLNLSYLLIGLCEYKLNLININCCLRPNKYFVGRIHFWISNDITSIINLSNSPKKTTK